jgi:hypothetical protein
MVGAPVDEIDATLLTFKTVSDRPVWSVQFRELAVACRPQPVVQVAEKWPRHRPVFEILQT